jgi:hypothetical protein
MATLNIQTREQRTKFSPGESISGEVSWQIEAQPTSVELRLFWCAGGRGDTDMGIVETIPFPNPQSSESRSFTLMLPQAPYSFSGSLITLTWSLELAAEPGNHTNGIVITLAPDGQAISLPKLSAA